MATLVNNNSPTKKKKRVRVSFSKTRVFIRANEQLTSHITDKNLLQYPRVTQPLLQKMCHINTDTHESERALNLDERIEQERSAHRNVIVF